MLIIWVALLFTPVCGLSQELYQDFFYYGKFTKLSACITKGRLSERYLKDGGCDLELCQSERMANVEIVKIRNAPFDEIGTGYIALNHDAKEVIVAFRASTTTSDWISNFDISYKDYVPQHEYADIPKCQGCKLHRGFYRYLNSITEDIIALIKKIYQEKKYQNYKLVLVGHSLGGALATLVGIEFRVKGYKPLIFSYGAPKMFNSAMMEWVNEVFESKELSERIKNNEKVNWGMIRVIHDGDYVPLLPPGFIQAGVEFFITKKHLPHRKADVDFLGTSYIDKTQTLFSWRQKVLHYLHAYEHRTYFMTINSCADIDPRIDT